MRSNGRAFKSKVKNSRGVALVVVLAFIVLLVGVLLAFFSQSMLQRQVAQSSASQTQVDVLAQGALETILGDLRQEIVAGSTVTNVGGTTLYFPAAATNAVVSRVGTADALPNLVKRTAAGQAFYSGGPSRAAALSSTNAAQNGRFVSPARWNKALLLPKVSTNSASDLTPIGAFVPPDWVYVNRGGGNPTDWDSSLRGTGDAANTNAVVGRFACAVYDEGGILDVNAAGYPASLAAANVAGKGGLPLADLTVTGLTPAQIDALVGWRHFATMQPGGTFPNLTIPAANATNWLSHIRFEGNGFLRPANTTLQNGQSDRMFVSRQQLIQFLLQGIAQDDNQRATLQNALQYLGTFSRAVNQPSYRPDPDRPVLRTLANGGNDTDGGGADIINPSFLTVRVGTAFPRNDGSTAAAGEPLVKKRFALNRLAWLTYEGPSASASAATQAALRAAGISQALIDRGTAANIQSYFGLTWASGAWTYRNGVNSFIKTLSGVSGREPDFFELLKAAHTIGALGKAYTAAGAGATTPEGYQQRRDNSVDAHIMQIAANIIDQFDFDGYPTRIVFNDGSLFGGRNLEYRGVEDLPYLYRVREGKIMTRDSVPSQASLPQVGGTLGDAGQGVLMLQPEIWNPHAMAAATSTSPRPTNFRLVAATMDPVTETPASFSVGVKWRPDAGSELIGPAMAASPLNAAMTFDVPAGRLDLFREPTLLIKPGIPAGSNLSGPSNYLLDAAVFSAATPYAANGVSDNLSYTGIPLATVPMAFAATIPAGGIRSDSAPQIPVSGTAGLAPTGFVYFPTSGNTSSFPYVTYRLQCLDSTGQWVTYDEKYSSVPTASSFDTPGRWSAGNVPGTPSFQYNYNKTFFRMQNNTWSKGAVGSEGMVTSFDPRSSRFGMLVCGSNGRTANALSQPLGAAVRYWEDIRDPWNRFGWAGVPASASNSELRAAAMQNAVMTGRPDDFRGAVLSNGSLANYNGYNTGPTAAGWNPAGNTAILSPGLITQNDPSANVAATRYSPDQQPPTVVSPQYFADADGVVRRGMSAYFASVGAGLPSGLPLKSAYFFSTGSASAITNGANANENLSRPLLLNRPFRSVAELGVVFSATPWRNLDFSTPESGAVALLDVFAINETQDPDALVAGRVNLNTRNSTVLRAVLAGAGRDELAPASSLVAPPLTSAEASVVADALVARTSSSAASQGPLRNMSDLAGRWNAQVAVGSSINGGSSYAGFSSDTVANNNDLGAALTSAAEKRVQRFRETSIRALAAGGQTRVWNLLIDLVGQTGRFTTSASSLDKFTVEGETRFWMHVAIDRQTGEVIDKHLEVVKE